VRDPAMMPWPITGSELNAMAGSRLTVRSVEKFLDHENRPSSAGAPSSAAARFARTAEAVATGRNGRIPRSARRRERHAIHPA
jgi:hypothetical protein